MLIRLCLCRLNGTHLYHNELRVRREIDTYTLDENPAILDSEWLVPVKYIFPMVWMLTSKAAKVVVPDYQLLRIYGRRGQKCRLAARLTWMIGDDIKSETCKRVRGFPLIITKNNIDDE